MRTHTLVIAAAIVAISALATKTLVFAPKADATSSVSAPLSLDELHRNARDLPVQDVKDPI
jgi:hypothetical protein